jgi:hypothetical protein
LKKFPFLLNKFHSGELVAFSTVSPSRVDADASAFGDAASFFLFLTKQRDEKFRIEFNPQV